MTPEQQLQQLLTEAEQVTAKMREALRHLPDYQPQPKLATTYDEVVKAVKPLWVCDVFGDIKETYYDPYQLPTESAAKQELAFIQIKNLEAYCADRYEGERRYVINISFSGSLIKYPSNHAPFFFTKEAADFVMEHFPEVFKIYYGVE